MSEVLITGGKLFLDVDRPVVPGTVWLEGDRIARIMDPDSAREQQAVRDGATVIKADGGTVLPGLIDAHTHLGLLSLSGQQRISPASQAALIFENLSLALDEGFTTLRDLGGVDGGLVEAIEAGLVEGPRLLPSGALLSQTAGHGDIRPRYSCAEANEHTGSDIVRPFRLCDGVDQATKAAREQLRAGATQLKVHASGGQLSEGDPIECPQFSLEELRAFVAVAEDRDTYVTAHCHTPRGIRRALEAGIRCLEHGTVVDQETAELIHSYGAFVVPTLTIAEALRQEPHAWGVTEQMLADSVELDATELESVRTLDAVGVELGSGSDLIGEKQDKRAWEIALKARLVGAPKAVASATEVNARILGIADNVGSIEVGKIADLIVYRGSNMMDNPEYFMTRRPSTVLQGGSIIRDREPAGVRL